MSNECNAIEAERLTMSSSDNVNTTIGIEELRARMEITQINCPYSGVPTMGITLVKDRTYAVCMEGITDDTTFNVVSYRFEAKRHESTDDCVEFSEACFTRKDDRVYFQPDMETTYKTRRKDDVNGHGLYQIRAMTNDDVVYSPVIKIVSRLTRSSKPPSKGKKKKTKRARSPPSESGEEEEGDDKPRKRLRVSGKMPRRQIPEREPVITLPPHQIESGVAETSKILDELEAIRGLLEQGISLMRDTRVPEGISPLFR